MRSTLPERSATSRLSSLHLVARRPRLGGFPVPRAVLEFDFTDALVSEFAAIAGAVWVGGWATR